MERPGLAHCTLPASEICTDFANGLTSADQHDSHDTESHKEVNGSRLSQEEGDVCLLTTMRFCPEHQSTDSLFFKQEIEAYRTPPGPPSDKALPVPMKRPERVGSSVLFQSQCLCLNLPVPMEPK